jgi:flagellar protein FlaJ
MLSQMLASLARQVFPEKFVYKIERKMDSTKLRLSAETFLGASLIISAMAAIATGVVCFFYGPWPFLLLAPLAGALAFFGLSKGLLAYLAQRRAAELERVLPDALRQMSSTLRAGVGIDSALEDIARSNYGELSLEFERVITEVNKGRPLVNALLALSRRSCSSLYQRAFQLIVEGIERGAALANVLDSVSTDIREIQAIQRERKAATTQQIMFLYAVALFAAPFIVGLTMGVSSISVGGVKIGMAAEMTTIAMAYNAIQAFICGLAVGVLRYGKISKGLVYTIPFMIIATVVFLLAGCVVDFLAPRSI